MKRPNPHKVMLTAIAVAASLVLGAPAGQPRLSTAKLSIAWGTPVLPDSNLNGLPYTVAIWSDPTGDGNPTDAVLLTTAGGVLSSQGTDTFITTDIVDTTITPTTSSSTSSSTTAPANPRPHLTRQHHHL